MKFNFSYSFSYLLILLLLHLPKDTSSFSETEKTCSGVNSILTEDGCSCSEDYWGVRCQYGRKLLTSDTGYIMEGEGKYKKQSKYMYLIDSLRKNVPIRITLNEFVTECNWDHLYIFDGWSVFHPLVAAYSGVIKTKSINSSSISITTYSGAAYIYFYSDPNIHGIGFNATYRISKCQGKYCNYHGICIKSNVCSCDRGWTGSYCEQRQCCVDKFDLLIGSTTDCYKCSTNTAPSKGRTGHAATTSGSSMWIYGGLSSKETDGIIKYDLARNEWKESKPAIKSDLNGHSMIFYADSLYVFGGERNGIVSKELLKYYTKTNSWMILKTAGKEAVGVTRHASVEIDGKMYVFFGYSKKFGLSNQVQYVNLDSPHHIWSVLVTYGALIYGRYGHTATYDRVSNSVYIYGGFLRNNLTAELLILHWSTSYWEVAAPSPHPQMLHSAAIIARNLIVFAGNSYMSSARMSSPHKCYSNDIYVYNIDCRVWYPIDKAKIGLLTNKYARYGHSAVVSNSSIYIFGGFNGKYLNDIFQITITGDCSKYPDSKSCLNAPIIAGCVWHKSHHKCIEYKDFAVETLIERPKCQSTAITCKKFDSCLSCTSSSCAWESNTCVKSEITSSSFSISDPSECADFEESKCQFHQSCSICNQNMQCKWNTENKKCSYSHILNKNYTTCFPGSNFTSCNDFTDCQSCYNFDRVECMWCESRKTCLDINTYSAQFPYGQCLEWIARKSNTGNCKAVTCEYQQDCQSCFNLPECGWCNDPSNTGAGKCVKGTKDGPRASTCNASRWHFTKCPDCRCNGHSTCYNGTSTCKKCYNNVEGKHCDKCIKGYFGNTANNGSCQPCSCNGHLKSCSPDGSCKCNLQGATGKYCETCESSKHYIGNATNGGMCYIELNIEFQYTTNLSHVQFAGFVGKPRDKKKDFKFQISRISGAYAKLNVSIHYANGKSTVLAQNQILDSYEITIDEDDYEYMHEYADVRAIVFGWNEHQHFAFKIAFTHSSQIFNLVHFLIMFMVCFCSLLILLAILWKAKQRYDVYALNRRRKHEHEERINRPFKHITVRLDTNISKTDKVDASQISCSPFSDVRFAVVTYVVQLPTDENGRAPPGQSLICFASTTAGSSHKRTAPDKYTRKRQTRTHIAKPRSVPV